MISIRAMRGEDVAAAAQVCDEAFGAMDGAPDPRSGARSEEAGRWERTRTEYLLTTDSGGSWVAVEPSGEIVGLSQAMVRGHRWVLSVLAVSPRSQEMGTGKALLEAALGYGRRSTAGLIMSSEDPKAIRLYARAGFGMHPSVTAQGHVNRSALPRVTHVRDGGTSDLAMIASVERSVAASPHASDVAWLLDHGCRLLVWPGEGFVVVREPHRPLFLTATSEEAALELLAAALLSVSDNQVAEVKWITTHQQWAVRLVVDAGLHVRPAGPVMTRGLDGLPATCLPSGRFG